MEFDFITVTDQIISEVSKLHIAVSQAGMVESVEQCYKEAQQLSLWRPKAICAEGKLIGFAMYGFWEYEGKHGRVWLDRFFIDERFQGMGYAKAVLPLLLKKITTEYGCSEIYLSVYESNLIAIHLYQELGFSFNGELDINGEKVMVWMGSHG